MKKLTKHEAVLQIVDLIESHLEQFEPEERDRLVDKLNKEVNRALGRAVEPKK